MHRAILASIGIIVSQVLVPSALPAAESVSDEIKTLLKNQVKAWNAGDLAKFMQDYWKSEKLTFSSRGTTTRGWQTVYDRYKNRYRTPQDMGTLEFKEIEVTELSDAALVLGKWHLKRKDEAYGGRFTLVFRKIDDRWLIIHDHTSSTIPDDAASKPSQPAKKKSTNR